MNRTHLAAAVAVLALASFARPAAALVRFAVISDYGVDNAHELAVSTLVKSWSPDFIITCGDNDQYYGAASTFDADVGKYYSDYILNYHGSYGTGSATQRFYPVLGNHDWATASAAAYLDYFTLPGNERYYDFVQGDVRFFALDSYSGEPDGNTATSAQAFWLKEQLAASTSAWNVVYFHHPAYSSGIHGSSSWMQWPLREWGASVVFSGHDHDYERLLIGGLPYFVVGTGGATMYPFLTSIDGSRFRYWGEHGAMLVEATDDRIDYWFYNTDGTLIDSYGNIRLGIAGVPEPGVALWVGALAAGGLLLRRRARTSR